MLQLRIPCQLTPRQTATSGCVREFYHDGSGEIGFDVRATRHRELRERINLNFNMVTVAHRFKNTVLSRLLSFPAVLVFAIAVVTACGGSSDLDATEPVRSETAQQDQVTAVPERVEISTVTPATAMSGTTVPGSQSQAEAPAPSGTSTPIPANEMATRVPATADATSTPPEATVASVLATVVPATTAPTPTATVSPTVARPEDSAQVAPERDFDVVTLLAPDAIPALNSPGYHDTTEEADESYHDDDLVLGIEINGDARAFSVPLLSRHEIVNDEIGGEPVAVTW